MIHSLRWNRLLQRLSLVLTLMVVVIFPLTSCGSKKERKAPAVPPPPTFTGPTYLHGTVASLTSLRGFEPLLVSGYGMVVGLNNTGSNGAPAYLRQWLINEMRRGGVGSIQLRGVLNASPEQLLTSTETAPVVIEGFIPPGAVKGTRFDVLVSALPQTETTSLQGGRLWTADLSIQGASPDLRYSRPLARSGGPLYLNPFNEAVVSSGDRPDIERQAVVLAGGVVTADRRIELILNQRSSDRARIIANRINERFPHEKATQVFNTAHPINDQVIRINIPAAWANRPDELLRLIGHLYLQRAPDFEPAKARQLGELLAVEPGTAPSVILCWQTLGKTALPVIREFQSHPSDHVRLAALEAGARMGDERTSQALRDLAHSPDPAMRRRAAEMLIHLPVSEIGAQTLKSLLDDNDRSVRIASYESMSRSGDPLIQRIGMGHAADFKFILDLIPSEKPLIYITQIGVPRVAIFNPGLGFTTPTIARLWDNRLMIRVESDPKQPATVFYQAFGEVEGKTYTIAPYVANFIRLMAHKTTTREPMDGLDQTYGRVVGALYELCRNGHIAAPVEVRVSPLAEAIAKARETQPTTERPESADDFEPGSPGAPGQPSGDPLEQPSGGTSGGRPETGNGQPTTELPALPVVP